jgi:hypothetical protein
VHAKVQFPPVECDFHTHTNLILTRMRVNMILKSVIIPHSECDFYTHSVIFKRGVTHTTVISTRIRVKSTLKVHILPARCDFTRRVWFSHSLVYFWHVCVWIWHSKVWLRHVRVWFIYTECDFYTHSIISTHNVNWKGTNVIKIRTRMNSTRLVRFPHAECDFTLRV